MQRVAIIDYGSGNLHSAAKAFERAARESDANAEIAVTADPKVVAETDYGGPVTAMVAKDNVAGTQFHPEKSQTLGLKLIANFLKWRP
jgi:imidazoleglycerol phosphate synthase glutamine amidotransferase subunit HisH